MVSLDAVVAMALLVLDMMVNMGVMLSCAKLTRYGVGDGVSWYFYSSQVGLNKWESKGVVTEIQVNQGSVTGIRVNQSNV
ncbi:Hypothetical protein MVR_LOCUS256 [uncultured virus]|nr:Hypothetical protein MVR_LOCUS256 [uncultured virus]